jgi:SNF2 family DNA or RNA helicase
LSEFADDPDVQTLLVTMGAREGAAGLNLTAASTVFILEPSFHPGLEAQAASR